MNRKELKAVYYNVEKRWNNGGREIYEMVQSDSNFMKSPEYKKYMDDNRIQQFENDFDEDFPIHCFCETFTNINNNDN